MDRQARDERRARRGPSHGGLRPGAVGPDAAALRVSTLCALANGRPAATPRDTREPPEILPTGWGRPGPIITQVTPHPKGNNHGVARKSQFRFDDFWRSRARHEWRAIRPPIPVLVRPRCGPAVLAPLSAPTFERSSSVRQQRYAPISHEQINALQRGMARPRTPAVPARRDELDHGTPLHGRCLHGVDVGLPHGRIVPPTCVPPTMRIIYGSDVAGDVGRGRSLILCCPKVCRTEPWLGRGCGISCVGLCRRGSGVVHAGIRRRFSSRALHEPVRHTARYRCLAQRPCEGDLGRVSGSRWGRRSRPTPSSRAPWPAPSTTVTAAMTQQTCALSAAAAKSRRSP
jgi:hypothetical protein